MLANPGRAKHTVVELMIKHKLFNSARPVPQTPILYRDIFADAMHALAAAVSHGEVDGTSPVIHTTLEHAFEECISNKGYEGTILASSALGRVAYISGEWQTAADFYTQAVAAGKDASAAGVRLHPNSQNALEDARGNLTQMQMEPGIEKFLHGLTLDSGGGLDTRVHATPPAAIAVSLCGACGARDAALKCGRCMVVHYCGAACQAADWRAGHKAACRPPATAAGPAAQPKPRDRAKAGGII